MKLTTSTAWRRIALWLAVSVVAMLLVTACERNKAMQAPASQTTDATATKDAANGKATVTNALYVCPMHNHIKEHGPGKCPICGMDLVKKTVAIPHTKPASDPPMKDDAMRPDGAATDKVLYYYDPMRPEEHFDQPGPSPFMDMQLIPKYATTESANGNGITVSAAIVQSLGIRTANPVQRDVQQTIRVPARVVADARGQARVQARVSGWVEHLYVRAVGQKISAGTVIADIYSPELVQAQEEMLLGAETAGPAAERLRRYGIADSDNQSIRRSGKVSRRLPLRATVGGVVTELGVREGSSVTPDTMILDLSGGKAVWIEAQLFPAQKISLGNTMRARFTLPGLPGREWLSETGTVVPVVDPVTQTVTVRFSISNSDDLPLGTLLDGVIEGASHPNVLLLPVSAVIRTAQGDRVMVQQAKNQFIAKPVKIGQRYGNEIEITQGIALTDRVVTSGQFLLDAEANLQSGFSRMEPDAMDAMKPMKGSQP
ncbi:MAG: efflux RND transporter periplasmic adaptor subunit [Arenimonas sp.]